MLPEWSEMSYPSKHMPEQEVIEAAEKMLISPCGAIFFPVSLLKPDGSPNVFVLTNNERKFSFDGAARTVTFTTTTSAGSPRTINKALPDGSYDITMVGCVWDDEKDYAKLIAGWKGHEAQFTMG